MQQVEVKRYVEAPRRTVWDVYTDHVSWGHWSSIGKVRLERQGVPAPNGVGCVRVITKGGLPVYEEVLSFDAPERMTYRVVKGSVPMKNHLGEVIFADHGSGTQITWRCRFESTIPGLGFVSRMIITKVFRDTLDALARHLASSVPEPETDSATP